MIITVPSKYKCRFPQTRAEATKMKPAIPTPKTCHPVSSATLVKERGGGLGASGEVDVGVL
jgi:hypothetical protein